MRMKKLFLAVLLLLSVLPIAALNPGDTIPAPLLVGHRGSSYGVENTEEAFRNGAKLGYQYVETDIKVTKDVKFALCHDDDLERWGHANLTISGSTMAELQAVTLTQKRSGVTYTGQLMELGEFLDLCTELNVLPVIELKWGDGVNSNDQSNMPALVKVIQDHGYYDKAIILTSMKPCLEWLHTNHPTMELQFLTGQYWSSHFDWCVERGIDVDIQASYFDKSTVDKFHEAGLKVNMWTTNTAAGYTSYTQMGCDFITTDNLDGKNLPVVTVPEAIPTTKEVPDTTDYTLKLQLDYTDVAIVELEGKTIKRVVPSLDGNYLYILAHADSEATLIVYDHINKTVRETLGTTNCVGDRVYAKGSNTGDVLALGNIDLADDGVLIGIGQSIVPTAKTQGVWLYKWENADDGIATGEAIRWHECTYIDDNGLWNNGECGEAMAYSGSSTQGSIYYSAVTAGGVKTRWVRIAISGEEFTTYQNNQNDSFTHEYPLFIDALPTLPVTGDYIVNHAGIQAQLVRMHADRRGVPTFIAATNVLPKSATHTPIFSYDERHYMIAATEVGIALSDISNGVNVGAVVSLEMPTLPSSTTTNVAAAGTTFNGDELAIFVVRDGSISRYSIASSETSALETVGSVNNRPRKVLENGTLYIVMPTGEKYHINGIRVQ